MTTADLGEQITTAIATRRAAIASDRPKHKAALEALIARMEEARRDIERMVQQS